MKILIADDDLTTRMMLKAVLTKWGYDVSDACDGGDAWQKLQGPDTPHLAVVDWMMPGLSGPELCRALRSQERKDPLYIILLTSKGERRDIIEGLESGADDYVAKPYDSDELRVRIDVGRRIVRLQTELMEREKFKGVIEMAGAVCHELNQPLQSVSGFSELLLLNMTQKDPKYGILENIKTQIDRIALLTRKIMQTTGYMTKDYMNGKSRIVDIERSYPRASERGDRILNPFTHDRDMKERDAP